MSVEDEEWKKELKKYKDICFDLSEKLDIPAEKKEEFMKSCENYAVQTGELPSLVNILEWGLASLEERSKPPTKTGEEVLLESSEKKSKETPHFGSIYLIRNELNGKIYIGQTIRPIKRRWSSHLSYSRFLKRQSEKDDSVKLPFFSKALLKYGSEVWSIRKIDTALVGEALNEKEKYWIAKYHSNDPQIGYNITEGGDTFGSEFIQKIMLEKWEDPKYRAKMSKIFKSPEFRLKVSRGTKKGLTPELRKKKTGIMKEKWEDPEYRKEMLSKKLEPELREKQSEIIKEKWKDPEYRKKVSKGVKRAWTEPELREKQSEIIKEKWKDPEYRKKVSKGVKESWEGRTKGFDNIEEVLREIEQLDWYDPTEDLAKKHNMNRNLFINKILEILSPFDVSNMRDVRYLLLDKQALLTDIKNRENQNVLAEKYGMDRVTLRKLILKILEPFGITSFKHAQEFLKDKNVVTILEDTAQVKNIEEVLNILEY